VIFSDQYNQRIRQVDTNGIITTIAGTGTAGFSGDGGPATAAMVNYPGSLVIDQNGNLYFGDPGNNRVREISQGVISTVAGTGAAGFLDGGVTQAQFNNPFGTAMDPAGNLYIADIGNNRIRQIASVGSVAQPQLSATSVTTEPASSRESRPER
jgi:hypothetical protein